MDTSSAAVGTIEEWRRKASNFSSTDRLGNLISRALEVLKGLARKEFSFPDLEYALESLELERTLALKHDKDRDHDDVRSLMYGVVESIGLSVNTMVSLERIKKSEERPVEDPLMPQMVDASISPEFPAEETAGRSFQPAEQPDFRLPVAPTFPPTDDISKKEVAFGSVHIKEEEDFMDEQLTDSMGNNGWNHFGHPSDAPSTSRMVFPPQAPIGYGPGIMHGRQFDPALDTSSSSSDVFGSMYDPSQGALPVEPRSSSRAGSSEKAFICEQCGRGFSGLKWLQNHQRSHQEPPGEKPKFECNYCGQKFTDRSNHRRHVKKQHEQRCTICDEKFDNKADFELHGNIAHGTTQFSSIP